MSGWWDGEMQDCDQTVSKLHHHNKKVLFLEPNIARITLKTTFFFPHCSWYFPVAAVWFFCTVCVFWVGKTGQFDEEGWEGGRWFLWDDNCKTRFVSVKLKAFFWCLVLKEKFNPCSGIFFPMSTEISWFSLRVISGQVCNEGFLLRHLTGVLPMFLCNIHGGT